MAAFKADGAIGSQFTKDGAIGQIGEAVGGPLASDGAIGKNFNPEGAIGGTVDSAAKAVSQDPTGNRPDPATEANIGTQLSTQGEETTI